MRLACTASVVRPQSRAKSASGIVPNNASFSGVYTFVRVLRALASASCLRSRAASSSWAQGAM